MNNAIAKLLSQTYEIEGLLLVVDKHGADTPDMVFDMIRDKASQLHNMVQLLEKPAAPAVQPIPEPIPEPTPEPIPEPIPEPTPEPIPAYPRRLPSPNPTTHCLPTTTIRKTLGNTTTARNSRKFWEGSTTRSRSIHPSIKTQPNRPRKKPLLP